MPLQINYRLNLPIKLDIQCELHGFTALLGRSGAGKTSLLKALAGLLPATGTPWANLPPQSRPVGYMPQGAALFPHLTALENAAFALTGPNRLPQAQQFLDNLGIGHLAARSAATLSGGEAQRVALARALARRPELLLLDEPSAGLDATTRDSLLTHLIDIIAAARIPALAATHDPAIAALADHILILDAGAIIQQGPARQVFENPETAAAARLLGYHNIWTRDATHYAIRAEDIEIAETGAPATITAIRNHGPNLRLLCAMPEPITVLIQNGDKSAYTPAQMIHLHFPHQKLKILRN